MTVDNEMLQIVEAFRAEARELAQGIGGSLLALEKSDDVEERAKTAATAYRYAHSIKGSASTLGFNSLERVVHKIEDILGALRDDKIQPTADMYDAVFQALDVVDEIVGKLVFGEDKPDEREEETIARLKAVYSKEDEAAAQAKAKAAEDSPLKDGASDKADDRGPRKKESGKPKQESQQSEEDHASEFVRVSKSKLAALSAKIGDMAEMKISMEDAQRRVKEIAEDLLDADEERKRLARQRLAAVARSMEQDAQYMGKLFAETQDELRELGMAPISTITPLLRRVVRDVCRKRGLEAEFIVEGDDYKLDRKIVEEIKPTLIHLLRNAADHGIEPAEERTKKGKKASGTIKLKIEHKGNGLLIQVSDDGRGVNFAKVKERAANLGLVESASSEVSKRDLISTLFVSGMTTSDISDSISGRGVGLDAARAAVENLKGTLWAETEEGAGTVFYVSLPLTLAADSGLRILAGGERYVVPRSAIARAVYFEGREALYGAKTAALQMFDRRIPLARLEAPLKIAPFGNQSSESRHLAVVLRSADSYAAVVVDEIEDESEMVVHSLGSFIEKIEFISGLTVTASGETYFVLNPADIIYAAGRRKAGGAIDEAKKDDDSSPKFGDEDKSSKVVMVVDDSATSRALTQRLLSALGYKVCAASDGAQALQMLRAHQVDLILSDVQMPEIDGCELARIIKSNEHLSHIPVVLLTSLDGPEDKRRGIEAGADAYILKKELSSRELSDLLDQLI